MSPELYLAQAEVRPFGIEDPDLRNNIATDFWETYDPDPSFDAEFGPGGAHGLAGASPVTRHAGDGARAAAAGGGLTRVGSVKSALARLDHIEIAIVRVPSGTTPRAKHSTPSCRWLAGVSGAFTSIQAIRLPRSKRLLCVPSRSVWLRARGKTHWSFKLKHRLPRGRYVMYVRTVDRAGVSNATFSAAKHTREAISVP